MKLKTKVLTGFLKKTRMEGSQQIDECILNFDKEGLKISANSQSQQSRIMAWLKKEGFVEYEELGKVGMNDLGTVIKVLERFGDEVSLKKEGNLLTIKGDNKKVEIELVAENFLSTDTGEPNLEFDDTFGITATQLKNVFKDVQLNKDAVITIETEEKKVKFLNTGKYKFENILDAPTCNGGVKVQFGEPLIDSVLNLDGVLEMSVKSEYPTKIIEKTETSIISIIIAPRTTEE